MNARQAAAALRFLYKSVRETEDTETAIDAFYDGITAGEILLRDAGCGVLVELIRLEHDQLTLLSRTRTLIREELGS